MPKTLIVHCDKRHFQRATLLGMGDLEHLACALAQAQSTQIGDPKLGDDDPGIAARDGDRPIEPRHDPAMNTGRGRQGDQLA